LFTYNYNYCDHLEYIKGLAEYAQVPLVNNVLHLPAHIGSGYVKVIALSNGLQVMINDTIISSDVTFNRSAEPSGQYFTLRFDEVKNLKALSLNIGEDKLDEEVLIYSGAFLTDSRSAFSYTANAGTEDRCINIYFTTEWLQNNLGVDANSGAFSDYLSLKTGILMFEVLNLEYRTIMEEIFEIKDNLPLSNVIMQNRLMLLLEKFFRNIHKKIAGGRHRSNISDATIKTMMQIESLLVSNFEVPAPTITQLARTAAMSETKLKNMFKALYGFGIYEYYQKNRMLRARQVLSAKKHSIKEVGLALGFKNLSNFTIAFKKEFNMLPSEL
jgi:AraC-like DNA-binding protein